MQLELCYLHLICLDLTCNFCLVMFVCLVQVNITRMLPLAGLTKLAGRPAFFRLDNQHYNDDYDDK